MGQQTFRYRIEGRVQGVSFRYHTRNEALRMGVNGFVRNLEDGSVEVVAQGDARSIQGLESYLHRGPSSAKVIHVIKEVIETAIEYSRFSIEF